MIGASLPAVYGFVHTACFAARRCASLRPVWTNPLSLYVAAHLLFSQPGGWKQAGGLYVLLLFLIFLQFLADITYLKIYPTDLRRICRFGRTEATELKLVFRFLRWRYRGNQQMLLGLVHGCCWAHPANGAAWRAEISDPCQCSASYMGVRT